LQQLDILHTNAVKRNFC